MPLRVFVVAKFEPLRVGLVQTLAATPDFEVVGDCASLDTLCAYTRSPRVDVFVLDIRTLLAGTEVIARQADRLHGQKVVLLGNVPAVPAIGPEALEVLMRQEAFGFVSTEASTTVLASCVRLVAAGSFVGDMSVMKPLFARLQRWAEAAPQRAADNDPISAREEEVLELVAQGLSNAEIAKRLVLSEGTVKSHISHIMLKLSIDQRAGLVRYALDRELSTHTTLEIADDH
jgi:DNA-binding NarL/FixJ family response regulator